MFYCENVQVYVYTHLCLPRFVAVVSLLNILAEYVFQLKLVETDSSHRDNSSLV